MLIIPLLYKVYMAALAERLREDVEGKGLIPLSGFQKRDGNIR